MSIATKALNLHNGYRTLHGASPLVWSSLLEKEAGEYATQMVGQNAPIKSKPGLAWGQNLYEFRSEGAVIDGETAVEKAVTSWYGSIKDYNQGTDSYPAVGPTGPALSFTQIVWKETQRLGLAVSLSADKCRAVVVALYDPPGNCSGEFATNVQKCSVNNTSGNGVSLASGVDDLSLSDKAVRSSTEAKTVHQTTSDSANEITHTITITSTTSKSSTSTSQNDASTSGGTTKQIEETRVENTKMTNNPTNSGSTITTCTTSASPSESKALELHNDVRRKHGVAPLVLDQKLCEAATIHANALLGGNKALGHVGLVGLGQNVYQMTGGNANCSKDKDPNALAVSKAFESWYGHQKEYDYERPMMSGKYSGLFAQIVWKSSEKLGVGVARRGDLTIVVCVYSEAGNIADDQIHRQNVLKPVA